MECQLVLPPITHKMIITNRSNLAIILSYMLDIMESMKDSGDGWMNSIGIRFCR